MTQELRISKLSEAVRQVARLGGQAERTRIDTNLEVIDDTGGIAGTDYIIIQDKEGFNVPAVRLAGVPYADGDLVNVLYVEGTEPIAFQQGSGSVNPTQAKVSRLWQPDLTDVVAQTNNTNLDLQINGNLDFATGADRSIVIADNNHLIIDVFSNQFIFDDAGNLAVPATAFVADGFGHTGDSDTGVDFATNELTFKAGNTATPANQLRMTNSLTIVNDLGDDVDTQVKGNSDNNLLYADAGNDRVGIGDNAPSEKLSVNGNVAISGASRKLVGVSSNTPDIGSTTAAEQWGNIYLALSKDIYPDNDIFGLWGRRTNYGLSPSEHFHQNSDDISWTGYAAYTGFASSPSGVQYGQSALNLFNTTQVKIFRYRSFINAQTNLYCRCAPRALAAVGIMVDDGVDAGDGEGANNFYRIMVEASSITANWTYRYEYRTGGGAVTTAATHSLHPGEYYALLLTYGVGTRWTSWTNNSAYLGETGIAGLIHTSPSFSWTPARHGLYIEMGAAGSLGLGKWDWFHEG